MSSQAAVMCCHKPEKLERNKTFEFDLALERCSWAVSQRGWSLPAAWLSIPGQCVEVGTQAACQGTFCLGHELLTSQPGLSPGLIILFWMSEDLMTVPQILRKLFKAGPNAGGQSLKQLSWDVWLTQQSKARSPCAVMAQPHSPSAVRGLPQPAHTAALTL